MTRIQPTSLRPRFGSTLPKVANRFEIDISKVNPKHRPIVLAGIQKFNTYGFIEDGTFNDIPDSIKFIFETKGENHIRIQDENLQGFGLVGFNITDEISPNTIAFGIENISQALYMEY